jgi:hypothetical protein
VFNGECSAMNCEPRREPREAAESDTSSFISYFDLTVASDKYWEYLETVADANDEVFCSWIVWSAWPIFGAFRGSIRDLGGRESARASSSSDSDLRRS